MAKRISNSSLRRAPKQERSRTRVTSILATAFDLIARKGIDAVTMKEIASNYGGPIASIYQYFPDKQAILARLHDSHVHEIRSLVGEVLQDLERHKDCPRAFIGLFGGYCKHMEKFGNLAVLSAVKADKSLAESEIDEIRYRAREWLSNTRSHVKSGSPESYEKSVLLFFCLIDSVSTLQARLPVSDRSYLHTEFCEIILREIGCYFKTQGIDPDVH